LSVRLADGLFLGTAVVVVGVVVVVVVVVDITGSTLHACMHDDHHCIINGGGILSLSLSLSLSIQYMIISFRYLSVTCPCRRKRQDPTGHYQTNLGHTCACVCVPSTAGHCVLPTFFGSVHVTGSMMIRTLCGGCVFGTFPSLSSSSSSSLSLSLSS
jgi:hypothetical protein